MLKSVVALVACLAVVQAGIVETDASNFERFIQDNPLVLAVFTAPWCTDACDKILQDVNDVSSTLAALDPPVVITHFKKPEDENDTFLKDKLNIEGFPGVKIFKHTVQSNYRGVRSKEGYEWYFKYYSKSYPLMLSNLADLEAITGEKMTLHTPIGFFKSDRSKAYAAYRKLATTDSLKVDFVFTAVVGGDKDKALYDKFGLSSDEDAVVMWKSWDADKPAIHKGPFGEKDIEAFIRQHSYPDVAEFGPVWAKYMNGMNVPVARFILDYEGDPTKEPKIAKYLDLMRQLRPKFGDKVAFSTITRQRGQNIIQNTHNQDKDALIMVQKFGDNAQYIFEYEWNLPTLTAWFEDLFAGKIRQYRKTEAPPKSQPNHVIQVVGKTFDQVVLRSDRDVMIEFYAPWCGHCKKLEPIYEKLAKKFRRVPSVTIAKMDATANEWDREVFPVTGFPTIYFVPGGSASTSPIKFQYNRDYKTMKKFIKHYAKIPFEFPKKKQKESAKEKTDL